MRFTNPFKKKTALPEAAAGPVEYILAGLGNPGREYETSRHNTGFLALDELARRTGAGVTRLRFRALCGECMLGGVRCLLMKPQTYMNLSGESVREAACWYKLPPERVLILYDDISLPAGKLRIRRKGTDGGHNGIKSIIFQLQSDEFPRIKIGVGSPPHPEFDMKDWVLSGYSKDEAPLLRDAFSRAAEAAELIVQGKTDEAMNRYN